ncbi:MAG: hypothetical protein L0287_21945 [Anaerolineae bacterium]|nr:hypothetical protein [Anaerolineae bacterium]MCI0610426.1 hypothetical protein [Anaerolineae bacterium]
METTTSSGGNKTILWIAGGCLAVLVCALAIVIFGFGGLAWLGSQTAENVTVQLDIPTEAQTGDTLEFSITITNISGQTAELISIDFSMNYLGGIVIENSSPPYARTDQFDALGGGETFQSFYFNRSIAPDETFTITFNGKATFSGDYTGSVDVCIDSEFNCTRNITRTIIK